MEARRTAVIAPAGAELPDAVVVEGSALPVPQLIEQLKQADGRCTPVVVYAPGELRSRMTTGACACRCSAA